jgi:acetyl/propionyl-CoA carboxylase alpha subunit
MHKVIVNGKKEYTVELKEKTSGKLNGKDVNWDMITVKDGSFHILMENRSYTVEVLKADHKKKSFLLRVNGNKYDLVVKDKYDELLKNLGMDVLATGKINEVKAPMPGLVLDVLVAEGAQIKQGDSLLVLEAMKMENVLKAPVDAIIKKINVNKKMAVEKNQVLITFE